MWTARVRVTGAPTSGRSEISFSPRREPFARTLEEMNDLTSHDIQALDAAKLYYSGLTQAQVAAKLHVARPTVSKLLAHAKHRGFVKIVVVDPRDHDESLVDTLIARYRLLDVVLVSPADPSPAALRAALGAAGAKLLARLVRDGDAIGVVPSRTLAVVADHLPSTPRKNVRVVQMSNGLSDPQPRGGLTTLERIAGAFDAQCMKFGAPTFVNSVAELNQLTTAPPVRRVFQAAGEARVVVYTTGDIATNRALVEATPMSTTDRAAILSRSVGDICTRFVDERGRICSPDFNNRTLGISLPDLRSKEQKILVAGGEAKAPVIRAALENGYVNRLVIDSATARIIAGNPGELREWDFINA